MSVPNKKGIHEKVYTEERPWGSFSQYVSNIRGPCTVKTLHVKRGEELSLQTHEKREEFWYLLYGEAQFQIGKELCDAKKGQLYFVPIGTEHRIKTLDSFATILEISLGEFDEEDEIRLEDKYGRS